MEKTFVTNYFEYQREKAQNPYIGFTSFQHFRNEALYSDVIVRPENKMRETENLEPYPVPDYDRNIRCFWKPASHELCPLPMVREYNALDNRQNTNDTTGLHH